MAGGAVAIVGFLPDVTEFGVRPTSVQEGYGRERLGGGGGGVGRVWWSVGGGGCGGGQEKPRKINAVPLLSCGGN